MKQQEKNLLVKIAKDLVELYITGSLTLQTLNEVKESFQKLTPDDEEWDKIMNDNFESFLKHVHDAHKGTKEEQSPCEPCLGSLLDLKEQEEASESECEFSYSVHCRDGSIYNVDGNSSRFTHDDELFVYFDADKSHCKAFFTDVKAYMVDKNDCWEDL